VNFNDIQDPESRIQDQSILSMVFIAAAKLDFKILCNYRVKNYLDGLKLRCCGCFRFLPPTMGALMNKAVYTMGRMPLDA